jgi:hypothetical protein
MPKPRFNVPNGATALVHIIDTTLRLANVSTGMLMQPPLMGFETLPPMTTWSFMVESVRGQKVLFDLGVPPDLNSYSPYLAEGLKGAPWEIESKYHVADILKQNGVDPADVSSVIWRYESLPVRMHIANVS